MTVTLQALRARRDEILRLALRHGACNLRVFGSVARGEADERSDVDILIDLEPGRTLLDHAGPLIDLRSLLQADVEVVTTAGLRARMRDRVLAEAVPL